MTGTLHLQVPPGKDLSRIRMKDGIAKIASAEYFGLDGPALILFSQMSLRWNPNRSIGSGLATALADRGKQ